MAPLPKVKLKVVSQLPATVEGRTGVKVVKENGRYYFDLDLSVIGQVGIVQPDQYDVTWMLVYNSNTQLLSLVPWNLPALGKIVVEKTDAGAVNVGANDAIVLINKGTPEATTVNLPSVDSKHGAVKIVDYAANAGTYNITIIPASGETINGQAQWVISGDGGSVVCDPIIGLGYAV
jgi:hypothetical protein